MWTSPVISQLFLSYKFETSANISSPHFLFAATWEDNQRKGSSINWKRFFGFK